MAEFWAIITAWTWCYRPAASTFLGYEILYLFLALSSASQRNIRLERSSWVFNTSHLPNTLVMLFHVLTKLLFNDEQVLHRHCPIPDPQYTDNEKHFMKSCLNLFPVVSMWMTFFGLNSFSSPVSPEFSVTLCLQGTITSLFSFGKTKWAKPLPFPPTSIPQAVLCSSSIFHTRGCHHHAQYSRQGLSTVLCKTARMLLSLHWEHVMRDILSLDLPFMVGSQSWQYSSWLAQWPSAFSLFPFPDDKFLVFSENSPH